MDYVGIEAALAEYGSILEVPAGRSMEPMLRDRRDTMVISAVGGPPRRGDVILFKSPDGKAYTLHRVIKKKEGGYLTRGDNCVRCDGVIPKNAVIGILSGFYKGERYYDCARSFLYKLYVVYIRLSYLPRCAAKALRALFSGREKKK